LTADRLTLEFVQLSDPSDAPRQSRTPFPSHDCVALFSGGVDSFVGTADLVAAGRSPIAVSHTPAGSIVRAQQACEEVLASRRPDFRRLGITAQKNGPGFPSPPEASQRSRSFLFLACALLVAAVGGSCEVCMSENGVMAIHVPMTQARIGSLSTHTAAPTILEKIAALAGDVLGAPLKIENQLLSRTKPGVVELGLTLDLGTDLARTVSCWSIGRTSQHCGICAPCIMRRISFGIHSVADAPYTDDLFSDPGALAKPFAADNLTHLTALLSQFESARDLELQLDYPELLNGGGSMRVTETIALYRTWASDALSLLRTYPNPRKLL
jgi:hypothetical protein